MGRRETGWALLSICIAIVFGLMAASGMVMSVEHARIGLVVCGVLVAIAVYMIGTSRGGSSTEGDAGQTARRPLLNFDPDTVTFIALMFGLPIAFLALQIVVQGLIRVLIWMSATG